MRFLLPFVTSFTLVLITTPIIKRIAFHFRVIDVPGERKIHATPIPLLGGVGLITSYSIALGFFYSLGWLTDAKVNTQMLIGIVMASIIVLCAGAADDKLSLKPRWQFFWSVTVVLIVLISGISIHTISHPLGGWITFTGILGLILTALWLLITMYTTKVLDGLDGLVSGITTIGAIIIYAVSLYWDVPSSATSILAALLAGTTAAFLVFNWHPASIFLGESGSVWCGMMLGILSVISGSKVATTLLIMGIPMLDVVWVVFRRIRHHRSVTTGDTQHIHHRLLSAGLTQRQTALVLYFFTATFGVSALFLHTKGKMIAFIILSVIMVLLGILLFKFRKRSQQIAR